MWEVLFGSTPAVRNLHALKGARGLAVDVATASLLVVTTRKGGTLCRVPVTGTGTGTGTVQVLATGLGRATAIARRMGDPAAWVLRGGAGAELTAYDLGTGAAGDVVGGLGTARGVTWAAVAGGQLAVADAAGRILLVDVRRPADPPTVLEDGLPRVWSIDLSTTPGPGGGGALVAGIGDALTLVDLPPAPSVQLEVPAEPLYLSGGRGSASRSPAASASTTSSSASSRPRAGSCRSRGTRPSRTGHRSCSRRVPWSAPTRSWRTTPRRATSSPPSPSRSRTSGTASTARP